MQVAKRVNRASLVAVAVLRIQEFLTPEEARTIMLDLERKRVASLQSS